MNPIAIVVMMLMAFAQNVSFSIVSRSRNRNSKTYHFVAAIFSNGVWFATLRYLAIAHNMDWLLMIPYTTGTVLGSVTGQAISMWIEKKLGIGVD
jgi:putative flippase GtrA